LRIPKVGRVGAHLLFGSNLALFGGLYLYIHLFEDAYLISQNLIMLRGQIRDKILSSLLKKIGCKHLIGVVDPSTGSFSQLSGGG
jgi:hypothetical protein